MGIYRHANGGLNFVFLARVEKGAEPVPNPEDILSAQWYAISEALDLPQEDVHRYKKLRAILADLLENRQFPCDLIRDIQPESWET